MKLMQYVNYSRKIISRNCNIRMSFIIIIIIIIIIRKGRQCKAGRERLTPYQSEDPNPTTTTHRMKEEKGKTVETKSERAARPIKRH